MMPGFFLFHAASDLVELVSIGARAGGPADERCRERDHGVSGYPGHDVGADPAAHAVRACPPGARMKSGKDVLWMAMSFNMSSARRATKDRAGLLKEHRQVDH
jgi:hypothetical protein